MYTVARTRGGVRNTSGITQKRQARGGAHLGLHRSHRVPQVGTSQPEVWVRYGQSVGASASVGASVGRSVGRLSVRWSVRRRVGRSVGVCLRASGWVSRSVSQMASQNCPMLVSRSIGRFVPRGCVGPVSGAMPRIAPVPGATPRASPWFCLPQVGHTAGFTAATRCPRWGYQGEARGVPHPPPCPGRLPYIHSTWRDGYGGCRVAQTAETRLGMGSTQQCAHGTQQLVDVAS